MSSAGTSVFTETCGQVRPAKFSEDRLRVLNLREFNAKLARHIQVVRRRDGEGWHALPRNAWLGFDREGRPANLVGWDQNGLLDGLNPEDRRAFADA